jgi:hypothetical protein
MTRSHDLKTHPQAFADVRDGRKRFEIRWDDRDFRVGDRLNLKEWDPATSEYTGHQVHRTVTYMLLGGHYGLPLGFVVMAIEETWREPVEIRKLLALATSDPGHFVGFKGERSMGQWMGDAVIAALRRDGLFFSIPEDAATARAQGRAEALALILGTDAETFGDDFIGSHAIADTGDYGAHWEEKPLRELLKADDSAFSLISKAEGEFWRHAGRTMDLENYLEKLRSAGYYAFVRIVGTTAHSADDGFSHLDDDARAQLDTLIAEARELMASDTRAPGWRPMSKLSAGRKYVLGVDAEGDVRRIWRNKPSSRTDEILTHDGKPFAAVGWLPMDALPVQPVEQADKGEDLAYV